MAFYTPKDLNFSGMRVLVRADFNVPIGKWGHIEDDTRIKAALPTIKYLVAKNAKVILMSHLGRPDGKFVPAYSLRIVAEHLSELLHKKVRFASDCVGDVPKVFINAMNNRDVLLLENLRFHPEEEKNDPYFAGQLAELGDLYVNDAFGTAHRAHASTAGICEYLPSAAGLLMEKEVRMLGSLLENPKRPFVAILGGVKVSDKIKVIENLLPKVDYLIIGGAMMFTFYKALGLNVGKSIVENDKIEYARNLIYNNYHKIILPIDVVVSREAKQISLRKTVMRNEMPNDQIGLDIGGNSTNIMKNVIENAKTIFWNGPMGMFEIAAFAKGTNEIAKSIADMHLKATTVVGGGDTVSAIDKLGLTNMFTHISTGGGASLEFLEGKQLPGIKCLEDNYEKHRGQK